MRLKGAFGLKAEFGTSKSGEIRHSSKLSARAIFLRIPIAIRFSRAYNGLAKTGRTWQKREPRCGPTYWLQRRNCMFKLKWLWKYMGKFRYLFVIGLILSAVTSSMLIINPMLSQKLIDEVITPQNTALLLPLLGAMMAVQLIRLGLRYIMVVCLEKNSQQMLDDVRRKMFDVIQNQDHVFFNRIRTGDLMTRMTNDLDLIRHSLAWISYNLSLIHI